MALLISSFIFSMKLSVNLGQSYSVHKQEVKVEVNHFFSVLRTKDQIFYNPFLPVKYYNNSYHQYWITFSSIYMRVVNWFSVSNNRNSCTMRKFKIPLIIIYLGPISQCFNVTPFLLFSFISIFIWLSSKFN